MTIGLGIDTSFDDTAVAIVRDGREILADLTISQFADQNEFGGVVPERASRLHVETIFPLLEKALDGAGVALGDLDYIAVANQPGLIGSLLVGVSTAKALAMALERPLIGVNHLRAHVYAGFMENREVAYPLVVLLLSGANTLLLIGRGHDDLEVAGGTTDDAAGECIDKTGRCLGLALPAGPALQELAIGGDPLRYKLPRPLLRSDDYDFSFSGLKTAVAYLLRDDPGASRPDLAAGILASISDVLLEKAFRLARAEGLERILLCGGVAANLQIRAAFRRRGEAGGIRIDVPRVGLCTDNAAMIAGLGFVHYRRGECAPLDQPARANVSSKRAYER